MIISNLEGVTTCIRCSRRGFRRAVSTKTQLLAMSLRYCRSSRYGLMTFWMLPWAMRFRGMKLMRMNMTHLTGNNNLRIKIKTMNMAISWVSTTTESTLKDSRINLKARVAQNKRIWLSSSSMEKRCLQGWLTSSVFTCWMIYLKWKSMDNKLMSINNHTKNSRIPTIMIRKTNTRTSTVQTLLWIWIWKIKWATWYRTPRRVISKLKTTFAPTLERILNSRIYQRESSNCRSVDR